MAVFSSWNGPADDSELDSEDSNLDPDDSLATVRERILHPPFTNLPGGPPRASNHPES